MVDACSEDLDYLRKHWKARVKKSHRKADKYNQKKKRKAVEDRTATNRKLSEQQQARCERWAAATRDILEAHPGASMREYRNPRRLPASRQMWRQGQAVLPLHQRVRVSLQAYSPTCVAATRWKRSIGTQRH